MKLSLSSEEERILKRTAPRSLRHLSSERSGRHSAAVRGRGIEFSEYSAWREGDAASEVDWKVYARTERMVVRRHEDDRSLSAWVFTDHSESMACPFEKSNSMTRLEAAVRLSFYLGRWHLMHREIFGLACFADDITKYFPSTSQAAAHRRMSRHLEHLEGAEGITGYSKSFRNAAQFVRPRSDIYILSDFYTEPAELLKALAPFFSMHCRVKAVHLVDEAEMSALDGEGQWIDSESRRRTRMDSSLLASRYRQACLEHWQELESALRGRGAELIQINCSKPVFHQLMTYLKT